MSVRDRIKMMEQMAKKEEGATDERGRSPGGVSSVRSNASDSPRPLSKVRTSFVAIEKDGRIGLARQASGDSNISARKLSGDPETASSILQDHTRTNVSSPDSTRSELNRGAGTSAISPASAQNTESTSATTATEPSASTRPPAFSGPTASALSITGSSSPNSPAAPASQITTATRGFTTPSGPAGPASGKQEGLAEPAQIRQAPRGEAAKGTSGWIRGQAAQESPVPPVPSQAQEKGPGSKSDLGGNIGSSGGSASGGAAVTPTLNGAVDKAKTAKPAPAPALRSPSSSSSQAKAVSQKAPRAAAAAPKRSATPPPEKPATEKKTPSTVSPGFVKPRPKSPTRPVKLPASLTTHTAASGQRTKNAGPPPAHANRPQSRTSGVSNGKPVKRSASVAARQRPSIGPPPKQTAKDHPVPKREIKAPDESFLARMTRPTQASANKVAEKVQVPTTPPRKVSAAIRKPPSAKTGPTRRVVSKPVSATTSAAATPEVSKKEESVPGRELTRKISKTAIAEGPITVAKRTKANRPQKISEENVEAPTSTEPESVPEKNETKVEDVPKATEKKEDDDAPNTSESDVLKTSEQKGLDAQSSEKTEGAPKASDALFADFMNPSTEKTDTPQTNGIHEQDKTNGHVSSQSLDTLAGAEETQQPATAAQHDEEEEL